MSQFACGRIEDAYMVEAGSVETAYSTGAYEENMNGLLGTDGREISHSSSIDLDI